MLYGIYFFRKYPSINTIKVSYVYVEHEDSENDLVLERKYLQNYESQLLQMISDAESDQEFKKCPSKLCDYCEYKQHCGNDNE